MSFDQIVCTGVLHHLADPDAGLRALRSVLKPDGAMHLMVYAPYGRTGIYMLQDFCRRLAIDASDDAIRDLIVALGRCRQDIPWSICCERRRTSGRKRRLPMHCCTRRTGPTQFRNCSTSSTRGGLTFGRWVKQAPTPSLRRHGADSQAARLADLPLSEQYAAVELFRGTMVRHNVVVYRDDHPNGCERVAFTGDAWRGYVPIRMADTKVFTIGCLRGRSVLISRRTPSAICTRRSTRRKAPV